MFYNAVFKIKLKKRRIYFADKEKLCNFEILKNYIINKYYLLIKTV